MLWNINAATFPNQNTPHLQKRNQANKNSQDSSRKRSRSQSNHNSRKEPENLLDAQKTQEIQSAFQQYCESKRKTRKKSSAGKTKTSSKNKGT
jgi:hypothetical protein